MQTEAPNLSPPSEPILPRKWLWLTALAIAIFYALLWSPWWYPLSDSALYLNMARALMQGKGWESLRQMHRDVRPLTPLLLFCIMKLGGGIGAMHAVMIGLMLAAHSLTFLTIRRWFDERLALLATLATATSWWVYANAFTIMTEPLFLVMFWAAMLALSHLPQAKLTKQWLLVIVAVLLMAGAFENRVAAVLLIPGMLFGLWMSNREVCWNIRAGWVSIFIMVFAVLIWDYRRPIPGAAIAVKNEESYHLNLFVGIKNPIVDLPVSAGRWVIEGLAAAGAVPFEISSLRGIGSVAAVLIFAIACLGWWKMWRGRHWYAIGMAFYFMLIFVQWGARIKPRYMTPIAPILFIQLCHAFSGPLPPGTPGGRVRVRGSIFGGVTSSRRKDPLTLTLPPRSTWGGGDWRILIVLLILNGVLYGVEWYLRHGTSQNFYDVTRKGGYAELVDIGAYLQHHAPRNAEVWVNWPSPSSRPPDATFAPDRRIVQFLSNREVRFMQPNEDHTLEGTLAGGLDDHPRLNAFFKQVEGDWAIVYFNRLRWPSYHLPFLKDLSEPRWWKLYHRKTGTAEFEPVDVPRERDYVRGIPGVGR